MLLKNVTIGCIPVVAYLLLCFYISGSADFASFSIIAPNLPAEFSNWNTLLVVFSSSLLGLLLGYLLDRFWYKYLWWSGHWYVHPLAIRSKSFHNNPMPFGQMFCLFCDRPLNLLLESIGTSVTVLLSQQISYGKDLPLLETIRRSSDMDLSGNRTATNLFRGHCRTQLVMWLNKMPWVFGHSGLRSPKGSGAQTRTWMFSPLFDFVAPIRMKRRKNETKKFDGFNSFLCVTDNHWAWCINHLLWLHI